MENIENMHSVPVLMYHHINHNSGDIVTVSPEVFEAQMAHLKEEGYRTLNLDELVSFINEDLLPDGRSAVVTFDDGWLDNYIYAYPVIKKYNINASVFLITDRVDMASGVSQVNQKDVPSHEESKKLIAEGEADKVVMGWELVRQMHEEGLVDFYPHCRSHRRCAGLSEAELVYELKGSKDIIEERLQLPRPYFCWPYGSYDETSIKAAKDAGFEALFTTDEGFSSAGSDPYRIKRIDVKDDLAWFRSLLN